MNKTVIVLILSFLVLAISYFSFQIEVYRFIHNVKKYAELNIPQNTGLHQKALISLQSVAALLPQLSASNLVVSEANASVNANFLVSYAEPRNSVLVSTSEELIVALSSAVPDSQIIILPGTYKIHARKVELKRTTNQPDPIVVKAYELGAVTLELDSREGFYIDSGFWIIENLIFKGVCDFDTKCDHAMHIVGDADNLIIQNNRFHNFNAAIKANGIPQPNSKNRIFPDNVNVINNTFTNDWVRDTDVSVTPIDVVGGDNWLIKGNLIADFAKKRGNKVTYGMFLKGAGSNGVITDNIVACEWKLPHVGVWDTRIGISLGGGGTGNTLCQVEGCPYEHQGGIIANNRIMNCQNDVGIYLNSASATQVMQNTLINTFGIDARFESTSGVAFNNELDGKIRNRDGASLSFD